MAYIDELIQARDAALARVRDLEASFRYNSDMLTASIRGEAETQSPLAAMTALLGRLRENHPNNDPGYGVGQMASGKVTQEMWADVDAALKAAGEVT